MKKMSMVLAVMLFIAFNAVAQLSSTYAGWGDTAVKWLMTKEEKAQWKAVRTDAEAKKFVDLFWARRDPTPTTQRNEFREEFDLRVGLADQSFTTTKTKGSLSDRGRAMILLGSPYTVTTRGGTGRAASNPTSGTAMPVGVDGTVEVGAARGQRPMIVWTYASDKKPKFIDRKNFEVVFSDERGGGEYEFAITPRSNPEAFFGAAIEAYVVNPNLTDLPVYADATPAIPAAPETAAPTSFRNAVLKEAVDAIRAQKTKSVGTAYLTWGEFVTPTGENFVPVSLYIPASAGVTPGSPVTFFGVVENAAGQVVEVHEQEATLAALGKDAYFDKSLKLAPGKYTAMFGVATAGKPVAMTTAELNITGLDPVEAAVSQLILTNATRQLPEQKTTDPYTFGGLKVVPKGDASFTTNDDFTYFFEVRNPGVDEAGNPKLMAKVDITGKTADQKTVNMNFPMTQVDALPVTGVKGRYGVIQAFSLNGFKPGDYTIKLRVRDSVLNKNYDFERQFTIRNP